MTSEEELRRLLTEIRDIQRDHLAEYRRVTERSLDLQQRAVSRQEQMVQVYRRLSGDRRRHGGDLAHAARLSPGQVVALPVRHLSAA
jgi:hypothetical protein